MVGEKKFLLKNMINKTRSMQHHPWSNEYFEWHDVMNMKTMKN